MIGKELSSIDGLPFQQRSMFLAVTVVKINRVFVVAFDARIMSVAPSVVRYAAKFEISSITDSLHYRRNLMIPLLDHNKYHRVN